MSFYSRVVDTIQERNGWAYCVYLDLKKAFDKVPHRRLPWKMEHDDGLRGDLLGWMENFLTEREMRTVVKDWESSQRKTESGVPKSSVLAPVIYE